MLMIERELVIPYKIMCKLNLKKKGNFKFYSCASIDIVHSISLVDACINKN